MNLMARISNGLQIEVGKVSIDLQLDSIGSFKVDVLARDVDYRTLELEPIEIIYDGNIMISGYINKIGSLKVDKNSALMVSLDCDDELGRLSCYRALNNAHYQDVGVTTIINTLLGATGGDWVLSLVNMPDPTITTTVDLRGKKRLFEQIKAVATATPDVHLRYGGKNVSDQHILEIGNFNEVGGIANFGSNLKSIVKQIPTHRIIKAIEANGDLASSQLITLQDALSDARTTLHPDYATFPISLVGGGYVCTNTSLTKGCEERRKYQIHKTKNDVAPTAAEVAEAGYALWLKTVRDLKSRDEYETFSIEAYYPSIPNVGDKLRVNAKVKEPAILPNGSISYIETFTVEQDLRITKVSTNLENAKDLNERNLFIDSNFILCDIEVTTNDEAEVIDPDLVLFQELERFDSEDTGTSAITAFAIDQSSTTHNTVGDPSDASCLPATAKEFIVTQPSAPVGAASVHTFYVVSPANSIVNITVLPTAIGQDWEACVEQNGGGWSAPAQDITVTVFWQFF